MAKLGENGKAVHVKRPTLVLGVGNNPPTRVHSPLQERIVGVKTVCLVWETWQMETEWPHFQPRTGTLPLSANTADTA